LTVTEVKQALGSWELRLRDNTPKSVLDQLDYFGHIAIIPNRVNPAEYGDALLNASRYVGVYRSRSSADQFLLRGSGMAFWLGDEDNKGDIFESAVTLTGATFAASVAALLPPGGAVTAGTIHSVAGTYSNTHRWQTSRQALDYMTSTFQGEWRVNNNATLDAGLVQDLYVTTPRAMIMRHSLGRDLAQVALPGRLELGTDAEDFTTRVVLLAEGEGDQIQTGDADIAVNPFNDLHGNDVKFTRLISESETDAANADLRAQLYLNQFSVERQSITLSTGVYDIKGNVQVGDYVNVYDPDSGLFDPSREVYWEGQPINPIAIRVVEMTWPVPEGWTVAFRRNDGTWIDLSPYYAGESGDTSIVVGDLSRSLHSSEPVGVRPNLPPSGGADTSIPNSPAFLSWSFGAYQSSNTNTTKAAIRVTWSTPLNTDSSTITDGDHYEIRFRVSEVLGYQVRWGQVTAYRWGGVSGNRWGAPISEPVSADPEWIYMNVPWGTNETTILELTPGVTYEFQIRAVDAAYPPHQGPWSAASFQTTTGDLFAPSAPAAPTVAGNMAAIQVTHTLGKNSGGTYNLEADLVRLDVHVGGSNSFYPDETNQVGQLSANIGMIQGRIAAVGTFPIPQIEQVHVKVVAVDRTGNKSSASPSATVTAQLIDDSHISNLSVSKLTAGTITAQTILANLLEVGSGGTVSVTQGSFLVKDALGRTIIQMGLLPDGKYGFRVNDASGNPQIRAGELVSGGYGLEAVDETGQLVSLSTLAFGMEAASAMGAITVDTGGGSNPIRDPDGLGLYNIRIGNSRRCLVVLSSEIQHNLNDEFIHSGSMSLLVRNRTTGLTTLVPSSSWDLYTSVGGNVTGVPEIPALPSGNKMSHVGLIGGPVFGPTHFPTVPGDYDFEVWYHASGEVYFQSRMIVVMPF